MREIVLILATVIFLPLCLRYPAAGLICWEWFSLMNPHRQIYGFAEGLQFNLLIAVATLAGWLLSSERKRWSPDLMPKLLLAFVLWTTLNSFFSVVPEVSWPIWDRTVRALTVVFLVFFLVTTKARVHGLIWIACISIGYYAIKGAIFTISTGGNYIVMGPQDSIMTDNNQLGLVIVTTIPLLHYLRLHSGFRALQVGLAFAIFLEIVAVLGTHSRGAVVALAAVLVVFLLSSRHKIVYVLVGTPLIVAALGLMPDSYFLRLDTIGQANQDSSFMGRVNAWYVAINIAADQFPFGAGFYVPQLPWVFHLYLPDEIARAAHSIYFQVLGEQGFVGLALYIGILVLAFRNAGLVMRQTRGRSELLWAYDLANSIRLAMVGFCVGGAALSLAYFDGFMLLIAVLSTLREMTAHASVSDLGASVPPVSYLRDGVPAPAQIGVSALRRPP